MTTPYAVQVIADSSGEFVGNGLRFETIDAAREYGLDLALRWTSVRDFRVVDPSGAVVYPEATP